MPDHDLGALAGPSVARHLARGAIGFGLIGAALALTASLGPIALLLAPAGMVALRGCPTCWIAALIETVSAGRLRRTCNDGSCTLSPPPASQPPPASPPTGAAIR
jgi:hypothetical protein